MAPGGSRERSAPCDHGRVRVGAAHMGPGYETTRTLFREFPFVCLFWNAAAGARRAVPTRLDSQFSAELSAEDYSVHLIECALSPPTTSHRISDNTSHRNSQHLSITDPGEQYASSAGEARQTSTHTICTYQKESTYVRAPPPCHWRVDCRPVPVVC